MSLVTDKVFYNALMSNASLVETVDGRIYNTTIPGPDEELPNTPMPIIIISFDGMQNDGFHKDSSYEGCVDKVQISIEVEADDREQVMDIVQAVRDAVSSYFENAEEGQDDYELVPLDYQLSASPVEYDSKVPCFFQSLLYNCDTNP